jgi:hypothetical protein
MDKGFYSEVNVDALYDRHIKFMVGVSFTVGYANEYVDKAREDGIFSPKFKVVFRQNSKSFVDKVQSSGYPLCG